ncbi:hypothetical protein EVAR_82121_1 [Eumeta japonica]|uniref:Uncharacterized protein n=1 Tax=Eumeta variegata TaxID=151549 RepID=A0A4C1U1X8_EUMVA|nr:hypothetical protein EVAR_82121_1 [Eumeta japonica]
MYPGASMKGTSYAPARKRPQGRRPPPRPAPAPPGGFVPSKNVSDHLSEHFKKTERSLSTAARRDGLVSLLFVRTNTCSAPAHPGVAGLERVDLAAGNSCGRQLLSPKRRYDLAIADVPFSVAIGACLSAQASVRSYLSGEQHHRVQTCKSEKMNQDLHFLGKVPLTSVPRLMIEEEACVELNLKWVGTFLPSRVMPLLELNEIKMGPHGKHQLSYKKEFSKSVHPVESSERMSDGRRVVSSSISKRNLTGSTPDDRVKGGRAGREREGEREGGEKERE